MSESAEEHKSKNLKQNVQKKKQRRTKVRQKYKLDLVVFQSAVKLLHCTGTGKWSTSAGVISLTDKELYALHGVSQGAGPHREKGTDLHKWPHNCQQLAWSGLAVLKPLWVQIQISCVYQ